MRIRIVLLTALSALLAGATPAIAQTKQANPPPPETTPPAVAPSGPEDRPEMAP